MRKVENRVKKREREGEREGEQGSKEKARKGKDNSEFVQHDQRQHATTGSTGKTCVFFQGLRFLRLVRLILTHMPCSAPGLHVPSYSESLYIHIHTMFGGSSHTRFADSAKRTTSPSNWCFLGLEPFQEFHVISVWCFQSIR